MATSLPSLAPATGLSSQKVRRAALKRERRKRKRQALAQARECGLKNGGSPTTTEEEDDHENADKERQQAHKEWLERERVAQEEFNLKREREETARKRKEEEEHKIKAEWEAQQKREHDAQEKRQQEKRDREEAVQKMLDQAESQLDNGGPWMNPEAPVNENSENYGTERDVANCPFFLKTGSCRFGERCSRKHVHPTNSPTLLIRGMFVTFGMDQCRRDDYDTDACLEHSEEELQDYFLEFYHDVLPEFRSVGKVVQFKVSCNFEPHLRGNVYVQFDVEEQCREALLKFNGRWYAGKQLHCELCPVTRWKNAICGLFDRKKCPKGKHCNFLHVFRNPGNEFWEADRDLNMSPDCSRESTHKGGRYSERYGGRFWRQRHSSRSPPRSERSHSRREGEKRRSRSRSRDRSRSTRASHSQREDNIQSERRSSRYKPSSSRKDRHRSKSRDRGRNRDRSRSRSRDRKRDRLRNNSTDEDREPNNSRSRERDRSRSRSRNRERKEQITEKGNSRSPKKSDWRDEAADGSAHTHRQHKRSKKSKKKSKKKHKKKADRSPEVMTSSGDSEKEEKEEEWPPGTSPRKSVNEPDPIQGPDHTDLNPNAEINEISSTPEIESNKLQPENPADLIGNGESGTP